MLFQITSAVTINPHCLSVLLNWRERGISGSSRGTYGCFEKFPPIILILTGPSLDEDLDLGSERLGD